MKKHYTLKNLNDFDWVELQHYYNQPGMTRRQMMKDKKISATIWTKAVEQKLLQPKSCAPPVKFCEKYLCADSTWVKISTIKKYIAQKYGYKCMQCGISKWLNAPLVLHLDHINGINDDHTETNLRLLCPNCHSQTDTYAGRNVKNVNRKPKRYYYKRQITEI